MPRSATSLVECTVRVSATLARLIRKCAAAEAEGAAALDALLSPVGSRAGELERLREQVTELTDDLGAARSAAAQLQRDLDASKTALARSDQDRIELERRLKEANAFEKKYRAKIADTEAQLADFQRTIERQEADLHQSVSIAGLAEPAAVAVTTFTNRLSQGDDVTAAALATAGYDPCQVDAALALQERDEIRALSSLLARPTWRQRMVLRLLGTKRERE